MALFLACILCISNTGCSTKNVKTTTQKITKKIQTNKKEVQSDFDSFLQDLFVKEKFTGIEFVPVKNIKTKQIVDNIVQLKINAIFPEKLKFDTKEVINCKSCNTIKNLRKK